MPRKKQSFFDKVQENYAGLILGAIIVVILGLLVANFLTQRNKGIDGGAQSEMAQQDQNAAQKSTNYTVEEGDSLSKIAEKVYGQQDLWPTLAQVNKITNPNLIYKGSMLEVPSKDKIGELKTQMTQTTYNVNSGDTLFTIAEKMYGDGSRWLLIAQANNLGRLPNGNPLVFADSTIKIPR